VIYRKTALLLVALAALGALAGLAAGAVAGWAFFAISVTAILAWHVRHLARLERWLVNPVPGQVPEGQGIWDEALAALHRLERESARREKELGNALAHMRRAVQALPDGVVILDSQNHIEWFNRTAETQLQLDVRTDRGQNIANLVREPEFVEYLESARDGAVRIARGPAD